MHTSFKDICIGMVQRKQTNSMQRIIRAVQLIIFITYLLVGCSSPSVSIPAPAVARPRLEWDHQLAVIQTMVQRRDPSAVLEQIHVLQGSTPGQRQPDYLPMTMTTPLHVSFDFRSDFTGRLDILYTDTDITRTLRISSNSDEFVTIPEQAGDSRIFDSLSAALPIAPAQIIINGQAALQALHLPADDFTTNADIRIQSVKGGGYTVNDVWRVRLTGIKNAVVFFLNPQTGEVVNHHIDHLRD